MLAGVDHSMRCMTEETFGPTLPVMRVRDAEEALGLANDGPYGLQASVWTRDTSAARRSPAGSRPASCGVNDTQLNYAALELPMGGWKASGMGSRHGPDGIRKYTKRQSLLITPGNAPSREMHYVPRTRPRSPSRSARRWRRWPPARCSTDAQRATLTAFCDTIVPSLPPPARATGPGIRTASGRARPPTSASPRRSRSALLQAERRRGAARGLRSLLDALAEQGMAAETPQEAARADRARVANSGPEALAGIATLRGLCLSLFYALPGPRHRAQPELGRDRLPGPAGAAAPDGEEDALVRRPSEAS